MAKRSGAEGGWIDVSVPLRTGMVHWPDNPPVAVPEGGVVVSGYGEQAQRPATSPLPDVREPRQEPAVGEAARDGVGEGGGEEVAAEEEGRGAPLGHRREEGIVEPGPAVQVAGEEREAHGFPGLRTTPSFRRPFIVIRSGAPIRTCRAYSSSSSAGCAASHAQSRAPSPASGFTVK